MMFFFAFASTVLASVATANDCCEIATGSAGCPAALYSVDQYSKGNAFYSVCCTEDDLQEDADLSGIPLCQDPNDNVFDPPSCCEQLPIVQEARGITGTGVARGIDAGDRARGLGITRTGARGIDANDARGIDSMGGRDIDSGSNGARDRAAGCQGTMIDMNINYKKGSKDYLVCCDAGYEGADFGGIPMCAQDIQDSNAEPIKAGADTSTTSLVDVCCTAAQGFCPADMEVTDVDTSAEGQMIEVCCNPGSSINIEFAELNTCDTPSSTTLVKGQGANSAVAKSSAVRTAIAMAAVGVLL